MSKNQSVEYEIFYFLPIVFSNDEIAGAKKQVSVIVEKNGAKIIKEEDIGKKKLSYIIKHARYGYFVLLTFEGVNCNIGEINKEISLLPEVLRHKIVIRKVFQKINIDESDNKNKGGGKESAKDFQKKDIESEKSKIADEEKDDKKSENEKVDLKELDLKIDKLLSETEDNL